jgi:hypothetical protein
MHKNATKCNKTLSKWCKNKHAASKIIHTFETYQGDTFRVGSKIKFHLNVVRLGLPLGNKFVVVPNMSYASALVNSNSGSVEPIDKKSEVLSKSESSDKIGSLSAELSEETVGKSHDKEDFSSVYAFLIMGFDFSHGSNFAKDVMCKFACSVRPCNSSGNFTMLVSFGRANFKLEEDLVSIALEAAIGGFCRELKTSILRERVFSFCVASKEVGFYIAKLRRYSCAQFKCYFHLWGRGGPNWQREFAQWQKESDEEWTLISPSKRRVQMGLNALNKKAPKPIIFSARELRKTLVFEDSISYPTCKGYQDQRVKGKCSVDSTPISKSVPASNSSLGKEQSVEENVGLVNIGQPSSSQYSNVLEENNEFNKMIADMVVKVWKCGRCFSMLHETKDCVNEIHCWACYNYGHIQKNCLKSKVKESFKWVQRQPNKSLGQKAVLPVGELKNSAISPPLSSSLSQASK